MIGYTIGEYADYAGCSYSKARRVLIRNHVEAKMRKVKRRTTFNDKGLKNMSVKVYYLEESEA